MRFGRLFQLDPQHRPQVRDNLLGAWWVATFPGLTIVMVVLAFNLVGDGIKPSSLIEDAELRDGVQRLWLAWTDEADADGLTDFYGLQAMAARAMFEAGECFLRFRPRRAEDGLAVPLQLQMLSSEHLPLAEILFDFYDKLKSMTQGYGSFDYDLTDYREGDLVKVGNNRFRSLGPVRPVPPSDRHVRQGYLEMSGANSTARALARLI